MKVKLLFLLCAMTLMLNCGKKETPEKPASEKADAPEIKKSELVWHDNLEKALESAKTENKTVFVNFTGSDWCGWCIKLKNEVFSKNEFAEYANSSLVLVELDYPQRKIQPEETKKYNRKILDKYGVRGFPTILLINKEGTVINKTGYRQGGAASYISHLKEMIK